MTRKISLFLAAIILSFSVNGTAILAEETNPDASKNMPSEILKVPIPQFIEAEGYRVGTAFTVLPGYIYVTKSYNGHKYGGKIPLVKYINDTESYIVTAYYKGNIYLLD
ncbi:hypothetical protein [Anaerolactibacter massiliensis]|uniref:hypothetical protein n=1 Tax=Anaerolactibacter massiliensis TaxID=2044573 RepID=UPI00107F49B3|nr:hypothetical protein [Anaerolactibacter massiliensis]